MKLSMHVLLLLILVCLFTTYGSGNEIGIATGINSSFYKSWYKNRSEYQKSDLINPIEIYYRKDVARFLALHVSLQDNKKSLSEWYDRTDESGEVIGRVNSDISYNFISIHISPLLFYTVNRFSIDFRAGVSGDFYVNQSINFDGSRDVFRDDNVNGFIFALVSGAGIRCSFTQRICVGINTKISRTITDVYKNQLNKGIYFINWQNTLYTGMSF